MAPPDAAEARDDAPSSGLVLSSRGLSPREALTRVDQALRDREAQLRAIAGEPAVAERLIVLSLHALAEPRLASMLRMADLATVFLAVREAAVAGLMPSGATGDGWLVPYWNRDKSLYDFSFQAGWKGLAKLLVGTAEIASGVAYANDRVFEYEQGSREFVRHVRALADRGERVAAWADATLLASGNHRVEIFDMPELEQRRRASKMADRGAWVEWADPMYRKTVSRSLCNRIPTNPTLERLLAHESEAEERASRPPLLEPGRTIALSSPDTPSAADRARQLLGVDAPAEPSDAEPSGDPDPAPATAGSSPSESDVGSDSEGSSDVVAGPVAAEPGMPAAGSSTDAGRSDPPGQAGGRGSEATCAAAAEEGGSPCLLPPGHADLPEGDPGLKLSHHSADAVWPAR